MTPLEPSALEGMTLSELRFHLSAFCARVQGTRSVLVKRLKTIVKGRERETERSHRQRVQRYKFHNACWRGDYEEVNALLDHGLEAEIQEASVRAGWTALYKAGHVNILRLLVSRGANVNAKDCFKVLSKYTSISFITFLA